MMQGTVGTWREAESASGVPVYYTFQGLEDVVVAAPGQDRWLAVASALAARLNCTAEAQDTPVYDAGTRCWSLTLTLQRGRRRSEMISVWVRW